MIQVSNEFKNAIKNTERRIKGYVEVLYAVPSVSTTANTVVTSEYTDISNITTGGRVKQNYGTLDYLPLDGSFLTMDTNTNEDSGFISDFIINSYLTTPRSSILVSLSFASTTVNGFTIYFKNNGLKDFYYELSDGTQGQGVYEEALNQVQIIFDTPKTITGIDLYFTEFEYTDRKLKIERIDLGVTSVYKDQDLIEFTVDEEVNKLVEEVPVNETNITLNNMSDLFNPLNPSGIVPYLSENTMIIPYIGILTESLGVEYVKMGEFYFDSYSNNSDATTTLIGKNILKIMEGKTIKNGLIMGTTSDYGNPNVLDDPEIIDLMPEDPALYNLTLEGFIKNCGFDITVNTNQSKICSLGQNDTLDINQFLKIWAVSKGVLFYANRNNKLIIRDVSKNIVKDLSKTELINDADYKKIERINTMRILKKHPSTDTEYVEGGFTYSMFSGEELKLEQNVQTFVLEKPIAEAILYYSLSVENATSVRSIYDNSIYLIIEVRGTSGNTARFNAVRTGKQTRVSPVTKILDLGTYSNKKQGESEKLIEVYEQLHYHGHRDAGLEGTNLLNNTPSYEMKFDYNGDPSLEAGDYINVETPYGYKTLFIQKNRFTFDGGLSGSIEGVE